MTDNAFLSYSYTWSYHPPTRRVLSHHPHRRSRACRRLSPLPHSGIHRSPSVHEHLDASHHQRCSRDAAQITAVEYKPHDLGVSVQVQFPSPEVRALTLLRLARKLLQRTLAFFRPSGA